VAKTAVFFFMCNHLGLAIMVQTVKKTVAEATFLGSGESSVKVTPHYLENVNVITLKTFISAPAKPTKILRNEITFRRLFIFEYRY